MDSSRFQSLSNAFICLLMLLLLTTQFTLEAVKPDRAISQYQFRNWNMESALPSNSVFSIVQSKDGFLWLGTQGGLVRFDGVTVDVYSKSNTPQLNDNVCRALYQGEDGSLWIGTAAGGLVRYRDGRFASFPVDAHPSLSRINTINQDQAGNVWIGSLSHGLTCLNDRGFTTYTMDNGFPENQVRALVKDVNGSLWTLSDRRIIKVNKPGMFQIYLTHEQLPYYKTTCLYDNEHQELWIGTGDRGLFRMKNNAVSHFSSQTVTLHPTINCLYRDKHRNLWIGTDGGGLARMDNHAARTLGEGDPLAGQSVVAITEDHEGSLWVGTLDSGLFQLSQSKFTTYTTQQGLTHDFVQSVYERRSGDLSIGTKKGLNLLSINNGTITPFLDAASGLLDNSVICQCEDQSGQLWIGTWGGLNCFDLNTGRMTSYSLDHGLSDNRINALLLDHNQILWIGTENGLNRFDAQNRRFTSFTRDDGLCGDSVKFIFEDSRNHLWIGTGKGLCRLKDNTFTVFNIETGYKKPIFFCAFEDQQGTLWFGCDHGLIRRSQSGKANNDWSVFTYNTQSGLNDNEIYSIIEDDQKSLWLAGPNGISRLKKEQLEQFSRGSISRLQPRWFNEKDGMKSRWCTGSSCKTRDGRLWFATSVGLTMIHPGQIKTNTRPPQTIIKNVFIDGKSLHLPAHQVNNIADLEPGKKRFEFHFTALSFINPGRIRFRIFLEGYDDEWLDNGFQRSATYTGLAPGHYTFKIKACNADGVWSNKIQSFPFYLRPYFYQTSWFFFLSILLAVVLAFFFHFYKVSQLRRRKKELSQEVALRTSELNTRNIELEDAHQRDEHTRKVIEAKNRQLQEQTEKLAEMDHIKSRFFANISHEFRTPLTLIKGPLEQILEEKPGEKLQSRVKMMLRNSDRLLNLVEQLLELAKFDSGKMKLQVSGQDIIQFVKKIVMCFQSLANQQNIQLEFKEPDERIPLYFDPEKLERVIFNILTHAFNHTSSGDSIRVTLWNVTTVTSPSGYVEISVRDTGSGIPPEQLPHIFDPFYQGENHREYNPKGNGIGLALTRELVELHHGSIEVRSNYRPGPARGTEFIVKLPLGSGHFQADDIVESTSYEPGLPVETPTHTEVSRVEKESHEKSETPVILIVDDNTDVREYIKGALKTRFTIIEAADGEEGIDKAMEYMPQLVVSDVMMPRIDGFELCCRLKKDIKTSHIPVILLTAKASEDSVMRGMDCLADDYITKPFNSRLLLSRVKNLIRLRRQLQRKLQGDLLLTAGEMSISSVDRKFMDDLRTVMEDNLSDLEFRVEHLAQKLYMGKSTLYRKVEALTGQSPQMFLRSYRLNRAAQLLKANFGNVTEVAFAVGFSSAPYFTKCFKEKFKTVPSEFLPMDDK